MIVSLHANETLVMSLWIFSSIRFGAHGSTVIFSAVNLRKHIPKYRSIPPSAVGKVSLAFLFVCMSVIGIFSKNLPLLFPLGHPLVILRNNLKIEMIVLSSLHLHTLTGSCNYVLLANPPLRKKSERFSESYTPVL